MKVEIVKKELFDIISRELSPDLTYHSLRHTQDVHEVCQFYAKEYELSKKEGALLEIAAVGHDIGFTKTYLNHEEASAEITAKVMKIHDHNKDDIALVKQLIMATKIPQNPSSFLANILCDADLDYLGRDDFAMIGETLKTEWKTYSIIPNVEESFNTIQVKFLSSHFFHTDYAKKHREPIKQKHLKRLEKIVAKEAKAKLAAEAE